MDSLSQGNKGLRYELTPPAGWGANVLGAADISVFRVANTDRCSVDDLSREDVPSAGPLTSTPVAASYSTGTDPVVEYWCVYAAFDGPPVLGTYENTASVTATSPTGDQVGDEDTWDAVVVADLDPAAEPDHDIAFTYTTFRPGEDL